MDNSTLFDDADAFIQASRDLERDLHEQLDQLFAEHQFPEASDEEQARWQIVEYAQEVLEARRGHSRLVRSWGEALVSAMESVTCPVCATKLPAGETWCPVCSDDTERM